MGEVREVSFDVRGEFITQMAKEWFFVENRGYDKVMELLLSCMEGTEQSEKELKRLAEIFFSEGQHWSEAQAITPTTWKCTNQMNSLSNRSGLMYSKKCQTLCQS